jgi:uncharacterized protein YlaN (UPF0358 family)
MRTKGQGSIIFSVLQPFQLCKEIETFVPLGVIVRGQGFRLLKSAEENLREMIKRRLVANRNRLE